MRPRPDQTSSAFFGLRYFAATLRALPRPRRVPSPARLWDREGKPLVTLQGHTGPVLSAVFARDGGRILSASGDRKARLWDRDGKPLASLQGHNHTVTRALFASDGGRILTASDDTTARLWEAFTDPQSLVDRVNEEVPRCLTPEQRERLFLSPEPPRWCIEMRKWPYDRPPSAQQQ
jgi:WD40 repeat protein